MNRRARARVDQVQSEITIGNSVDAVFRQSFETELPPHRFALKGKSRGRERARAQGHLIGGVICVSKTLCIPKQGFGVGQQVMADRHRLRALQVCVTGHQPARMRAGLGAESVHQHGDRRDELRRGHPAVEPQIQRDLVVARAPSVKRGAGWGDLGQASLDRRVDVLVGCAELELAAVELAPDAAKAALDRRQSRFGENARLGQPPSVGDAAGDVERVELEIRFQRGRELLELWMEVLPKASSPEFAGFFRRYGVSLFTSPRRLPSSRACSCPWTRAEVRTPIPHSLMKPAAAD